MDDNLTTDIVEAIAEARDIEPTELGFPLARHIDCDAIEWLDEHAADSWTLTFEVPEHTVTVTGDRTVSVVSHSAQVAGD